MNISYYTIDDLRLPAKRLLRKGWTMERFPTLEEALARYRALPASGIKALGLTDGTHVLEVVKCLPLFPDDREGEDVLASDYSQFPLWSHEPEAAKAAVTCIAALGLRYSIGNRADSHSLPGRSAAGVSGEIFVAEPVRRGAVRHQPGLCGRKGLGIPRHPEPEI